MREDAALAPLLLFSFKIYLCGREAVFFVFASDYLIFSLAKKLGGLTPAGFRDLREKPGRIKFAASRLSRTARRRLGERCPRVKCNESKSKGNAAFF